MTVARSFLAVVALTAALVGATHAGSAPSSGLFGRVIISPLGGPCGGGRPCSAPAKNRVLVFSRPGRASVRTRTRQDGTYRVKLAPGRYAVSTPGHGPGNPGRGLEPSKVTVRKGAPTRANFTLDVGLR